MNPNGHDMYYPSHMSAGQAPPPQTVTSPYSHPHQHQHQHPHPPVLQPGPPTQYPAQYGGQYTYANGMASPAGQQPVSNQMNAPQPVLPLPGINQPGMGPPSYSTGFDTTGQIAPPGMKPRVTATLWEDEGSLCFQVEARGICVARREGKLPCCIPAMGLNLTCFSRQPHDQRYQAAQRCRHDARPS